LNVRGWGAVCARPNTPPPPVIPEGWRRGPGAGPDLQVGWGNRARGTPSVVHDWFREGDQASWRSSPVVGCRLRVVPELLFRVKRLAEGGDVRSAPHALGFVVPLWPTVTKIGTPLLSPGRTGGGRLGGRRRRPRGGGGSGGGVRLPSVSGTRKESRDRSRD